MRCDGRKVSQDEPIYFLIPYFLTHRYDAMNMITVDIPEEPLRSYMNQKRKEGRPITWPCSSPPISEPWTNTRT